MARPQLENGYATLACELLAAISVADFKRYQLAILGELIAACYGVGRSEGHKVDPWRLGDECGVEAVIVRRALAALVEQDVVIVLADGRHKIQKDWERWKDHNGHLRLAGKAPWIRSVAERFGLHSAPTRRRKPLTNGSRFRRANLTNESPNLTSESGFRVADLTNGSRAGADESAGCQGGTCVEVEPCAACLAYAYARPQEDLRLEIEKGERAPIFHLSTTRGWARASPAS